MGKGQNRNLVKTSAGKRRKKPDPWCILQREEGRGCELADLVELTFPRNKQGWKKGSLLHTSGGGGEEKEKWTAQTVPEETNKRQKKERGRGKRFPLETGSRNDAGEAVGGGKR